MLAGFRIKNKKISVDVKPDINFHKIAKVTGGCTLQGNSFKEVGFQNLRQYTEISTI